MLAELLIGLGTVCVIAAVLVVAATMRSSQMSQRIVVPPERKRVETRYADDWRDELPLADERTGVQR